MLHEVHGPQFASGFWKNWTPAFIVCLIFQNQTSWSDHLTSLECAYNTIPTTVTDMSPFHCAYRYQLPWFQENDGDKGLPLTIFHGEMLPPDLGQASEGLPPRPGTDEGGSLMCYTPIWVWLSTSDLPLHLHSQKLAPRLMDPFPIAKVINPASVKRLRSLKVHPNFHIIRLNLAKNSPLVPPSKLAPPPWMIEAGQAYSKDCWLQRTEVAVGNIWLNGRSWMGGHE